MRVMIQNDKNRLFGRIDNCLTAHTKLNAEAIENASALTLVNALDLAVNDYLLIDNIDSDISEVTLINSISGQTVYLSTNTKFAHQNKTDIWKMDYNQIRFYENDTAISTQNIKPDYYQTYGKTVSNSMQYSVSFVNSITGAESTRGEKIYGSEYLLCGIGDITQFEPADIIGGKILDKIDIATRVVRAKFTNQKQNFTDLENPEVLRLPTAFLALHYYFLELIKSEKDISTIKSNSYLEKYDAEIARATDLINTVETKVQVFGQAQCIR